MRINHPFYSMIVSRSKKAIYCPIPKAACTTWKEYFRISQGLPPSPDVRTVHDPMKNGLIYTCSIDTVDLMNMIFGKTTCFFKFIVVRNPFTRILSSYLNKLLYSSPLRIYFEKDIDCLITLYCKKYDLKPSEMPEMSFEIFLECVECQNIVDMNIHWSPQIYLASFNFMNYDMIIQFEKMEENMPILCEKLGAKIEDVQNLNRVSLNFNSANFLTESAVQSIRRIYAADFRRFGYDPQIVPGH